MTISQGKLVLGCMSMLGLCVVSGAVLVAVSASRTPSAAPQETQPESLPEPKTPRERARRLLAHAQNEVAHAFDNPDGDVLILKANLDGLRAQIEAIDAETQAGLAQDIAKVTAEITRALVRIQPAVRVAERDEAKRKTVFLKCGPPPKVGPIDGELVGSESFYAARAHDPDSIDVEQCSEPQGNKASCWVSTCIVRGRNAFGAVTARSVVFTYANGTFVSARP